MAWFWLADIALLSSALCLVLASQANRLKLLATPGGHRHHRIPTPMVGGIAIFLSLLVGCILIDSSYKNILPCLFLVCAVGVLDDRFGLPSWFRFLAQLLAVYLMIIYTGVELKTFGNLIAGEELLLGNWSVPLTLFAAIGVINAVNMSDGLDGLAGCLVLLTLVCLLFLGSPDNGIILISISALLGFLVLNLRVGRPQARVFMGDGGSTLLGLLLAYLLINASQSDGGIAPVTALWLLALPLIDAVAVLIVRPLRGRSPFSADRAHYHHQLKDRGLSDNRVLLILVILQSVFIAIGLIFADNNVNEATQFYAFLGTFFSYFLFLLITAK